MFCEPELPLDEIYALLKNASLAIAASTAPSALVPRFELRLLHALGLAPPDDACIRCGGPFDAHGAWVDIDAGGLGCEGCYGARGDMHSLDAADVENFRALGAPRAAGLRAAINATPKVARAVDDLVTYPFGPPPQGPRLARRVRTLMPIDGTGGRARRRRAPHRRGRQRSARLVRLPACDDRTHQRARRRRGDRRDRARARPRARSSSAIR